MALRRPHRKRASVDLYASPHARLIQFSAIQARNLPSGARQTARQLAGFTPCPAICSTTCRTSNRRWFCCARQSCTRCKSVRDFHLHRATVALYFTDLLQTRPAENDSAAFATLLAPPSPADSFHAVHLDVAGHATVQNEQPSGMMACLSIVFNAGRGGRQACRAACRASASRSAPSWTPPAARAPSTASSSPTTASRPSSSSAACASGRSPPLAARRPSPSWPWPRTTTSRATRSTSTSRTNSWRCRAARAPTTTATSASSRRRPCRRPWTPCGQAGALTRLVRPFRAQVRKRGFFFFL